MSSGLVQTLNLRKPNFEKMNWKTHPYTGPVSYISYEDKRIPFSICTKPPQNRTPSAGDVFAFDSGSQVNMQANGQALTTRAGPFQSVTTCVDVTIYNINIPRVLTTFSLEEEMRNANSTGNGSSSSLYVRSAMSDMVSDKFNSAMIIWDVVKLNAKNWTK